MSTPDNSQEIQVPKPRAERLVSLDALRGFDIFLLLMLSVMGAFHSLEFTHDSELWQKILRQFEHVPWEGFTLCDLAMPLFVFMSGAAIPFALARYLNGEKRDWGGLWLRIVRRVVVLWIFGMAVQGNLLSLKVENFKLFSNTLQSIAVGYFFSCLAYLYLPKAAQRGLFVALLLAFWAACKWIAVGDCGGGSYEQGTNLAYWVDQHVLGRWMDAASVGEDGVVNFNPGYQYTWILSSLTFVATALSGMFAGDLLYTTREKMKTMIPGDVKGKRFVQWQAVALLTISGAVCLVLARFWNAQPQGSFAYCPIIKHIWTSSMVLHSSGISLLLLAGFYLVFDLWKLPGLKTFFVVFGTNAIAAYMLSHIWRFNEIADRLLHGLQQYVGDWYGVVSQVGGIIIIWLILWDFWRRGKFLRV